MRVISTNAADNSGKEAVPLHSELWRHAGLLTDLIGRNTVKIAVPFYGHNPLAIRIDRMVTAFSCERKSMLLQMFDEVTPADGHH